MSRLERLVSLLDTGSSVYVRQAAAEQLAEIQRAHPEELYSLFGRVAPFLSNKKWDTRTAAAKALTLVAEVVPWAPTEELRNELSNAPEDEKAEKLEGEPVKMELDDTGVNADLDGVKEEPVKEEPLSKPDISRADISRAEYMQLATLDLGTVLLKGTALLGSAGKEFDLRMAGMDAAERLRSLQQSLKRQLGFGADMGGASDGILADDDLDLGPIKPKRKKAKSGASVAPVATAAAPENARMRALAKRRQKMGVPAPESKAAGNSVKVEFHKDPVTEMAELLTVEPDEWPFERLCEQFKADIFCPQWESRHGALIGLRAILVSHGAGAGTRLGLNKAENRARAASWLQDLACRLCCVLALDKFADYVADEVVAPVRESCAQVLGTVLLYLPPVLVEQLFSALVSLVRQNDMGLELPIWTARHGGMLGLLYFVTVRSSYFDHNPGAFTQLIECSLDTLELADDDDVQAIAAATLRPVCSQLVSQKPELIPRVLNVVWAALENLKDDLSSFIGRVMDLLAELCSHKNVTQQLAAGSLKSLVPRLYPFLRHSITDVRKAVLRSLKIFLSIEVDSQASSSDSGTWVDARFIRLIFQNIMLEQNDTVSSMSLDLWQEALRTHQQVFVSNAHALWSPLFNLLTTPVGTSRRAYKMNLELLIKPNGEPFDSQFHDRANKDASTNNRVYIDGPLISGDVLIVDPHLVLRNRISAATALAGIMSLQDVDSVSKYTADICEHFGSPMVSRKLFVIILLAEYGRVANEIPDNLNAVIMSKLVEALETPLNVVYRDINPVLRAVRTQCQSMFSLMVSEGGLPSSAIPTLPATIEGDAGASDGETFGLAQAEEFGGPVFDALKAQLSADVRVGMGQALSEGRENLLAAITEARESLEKSNRNIRAQAAVAFVNLSRDLPPKQGPIIRALMDSIKTEVNGLLRQRVANSLCDFFVRLYDGNRGAAAEKVVKNLCSFLCVDVDEAPLFRMHKDAREGIMSLKRDETNFQSVSESLKREKETFNSHTKRKGALAALAKIMEHYKAGVLDLSKELTKGMFGSLNLLAAEPLEFTDEQGQAVIDNLAVTRALIPCLDQELYSRVEEAFPHIEQALFCHYSVLRFVAAKCFSTACKYMPSRAILYFVKRILPQVNGNAKLSHRQGALEATYHIMMTMGEQALPYIVYFLVPTMGRMSDSDIGMRTIAATTFGSIIKLVPLEVGVSDPPDMPTELLEGRESERKLISQMMDVSKIEPFQLPITIKAELRSYQQDGVNWLAFLNRYHLHGILCDDMGLGKTLQTICIVASDHHIRAENLKKDADNREFRKLPSLVVCPTSLTGHWVQEFRKYVPEIKTLAYVGAPTMRSTLASEISKVDVVITSYDIARNDVATLAEHEYNYHVLDEGHIIKNANSKLAKAIKQYSSEHRLVLSGTPIQNNVLELWSLFDFLMPGFLGNEKSFNERFSKPIIASKSGKSSAKEQEAASLALEALHKQVLPFLLRRLKEEVLDDLPPKIIQDYYCDLNDRQVALYNEFTRVQKQTIADDLKEDTSNSKKHVFQALMYMRRLCNHPGLVCHTKDELNRMLKGKLDYAQSPKLLALQQLLKDCGIGDTSACPSEGEVPEAASQHRALVFCQQKDMLDLVEYSLLRKHMPSVSYMRLDGSVAGQDRQEMVAKFNDDPSIDVLLLSTHVGGLGLNLTGADTVIFVEHDWNPMNDLQAMDRAHRIGQKKVVNVYRLITRNTLEERIMGLQEFKLNIASTVINQQNSGLGSMNTDQILDLFSVSTEEEAQTEKPGSDETPATAGLLGKEPAGLAELWDESEYAEEYNLDNFIKGLKK